MQRVPNGDGFEVWRQLVAENAPKDSGSKIRNVASRVRWKLTTKAKGKGNGVKSDKQDKECYACRKKALRARLLVTSKVDSDAAKEFVFTIYNIVRDVSVSQSRCEGYENGFVMIDSGESVNVFPKWFGESVLEKSDGSVQLRSADGRTLRDYGKRHIWLKIGNHLRQYDFHVVEVAKPVLSVSYLCENGIETPRETTLPEVPKNMNF